MTVANYRHFAADNEAPTDPDGLRAWAHQDPERFWAAAARWIGLRPGRQIVRKADHWRDDRWFPDADGNIASWARLSTLEWSNENGNQRTPAVNVLVLKHAATMHRLGVRPGDRVGILGTAQPDTVAALLACAHLGAIAVPCFPGFAEDALRARAEIADPVAWFATPRAARKGVPFDLPGMLARIGARNVYTAPDGTADAPPVYPATNATPWMLLFTSGTTGTPKGVIHTHLGWLVKTTLEVSLHLDVGPGDRVAWIADPGWVVFPWIVTGTLAAGGQLHMIDGMPTAARVWGYVQEHRLTHLGMAPSLLRALREQDPVPDLHYDLSSLRVVGASGEPFDSDTWEWVRKIAPDAHLANVSGGTEIGTLILAPLPDEPVAPGSLGAPALGMPAEIHDGELVLTRSWPGMTQGLWADPSGARFRAAYFDGNDPDVWTHGDRATSTPEGTWLHGRSDDTLSIHGKRVDATEIEHAALTAPAVRAAAARQTGPDGYGLWIVPTDPGTDPTDAATAAIRETIGRPFGPATVAVVDALPTTASGKTIRRALV